MSEQRSRVDVLAEEWGAGADPAHLEQERVNRRQHSQQKHGHEERGVCQLEADEQ